MRSKSETWILAGAQVLVLLICLGAAVWNFTSGMIFDIDGLLLLTIILALAAVFSFTLLLHAKSEGWLAWLPIPGQKKTASARTPAPAAEAKGPAGVPK